LTAGATEAARTLRALLTPGVPPAVRLGAARALLDRLADLQTAELAERVRQLKQREPPHFA